MRQRTVRRCYLRRLLGCFRHSGRSQRPEYRRAFRKTLRLHAVLRIALIHTRQRTALRCYLRRLAPSVRPPQPPKISFEVSRFLNRAGRRLGARRPEYLNNIRYLLRGQKVTPKAAAVKRFRGRSCDCAKSDACGTFEAIKRSPIFNAPSPRPPFFRNPFCRGFLLTNVYYIEMQFAAAPLRRTATRQRLAQTSAVGEHLADAYELYII